MEIFKDEMMPVIASKQSYGGWKVSDQYMEVHHTSCILVSLILSGSQK